VVGQNSVRPIKVFGLSFDRTQRPRHHRPDKGRVRARL
jgi:hypothetical protein